MEILKNKIGNLLDNCEGTFSVYIKDMGNNSIISINDNESYHAASLIKLPILWEALRQVQEGLISLEDKVLLRAEDKAGGDGSLPLLHDNIELTVLDLLNLMIAISDNTATNILIDLVGKDFVNRSLSHLGIKDTYLARKLAVMNSNTFSYTCAKDIGKLLEAFLINPGLTPEYRQLGLKILAAQQLNNRISNDLYLCNNCGFRVGKDNYCSKCNASMAQVGASPIYFPHKTGEIISIVHDAGILHFESRQIIVVALCGNLKNNNHAHQLLSDIGIEIYNYFIEVEMYNKTTSLSQ